MIGYGFESKVPPLRPKALIRFIQKNCLILRVPDWFGKDNVGFTTNGVVKDNNVNEIGA